MFAVGCKGCGGDGSEAAPGATAEPARSELQQLEHRIGTLKIDLTKTFPKRADRLVDCGTDADCFVVMAYRCEPAVLEHKLSEPTIAAIKKVRALYRITGAEGGKCTLLRLALERDMELPQGAREALIQKGKTEADVEAMRTEALAYLTSRVPERTICPLRSEQTIALALALATKEPTDSYFRDPCHAPVEGEAWPADFVAPAAAPAPAAPAPAAPTAQ